MIAGQDSQPGIAAISFLDLSVFNISKPVNMLVTVDY